MITDEFRKKIEKTWYSLCPYSKIEIEEDFERKLVLVKINMLFRGKRLGFRNAVSAEYQLPIEALVTRVVIEARREFTIIMLEELDEKKIM